MNKLYLLIFIAFLGCKKEDSKKNVSINNEKISIEIKENERQVEIKIEDLSEFKNSSLEQFYQSTNNLSAWGNLEKRAAILKALNNCEEFGLDTKDYNTTALNSFEKKIKSLTDEQLAEYDLLLTYNFQKFLVHLHKGKLNPKKLYKDWDINEKSFDVNPLLIKAFNEDNLQFAIDESQPKTYTYRKLLKALKLINTFPNDDLKTIEIENKIVLNDSNNHLIKIKKRLLYWKDLKDYDSLTTIYDKKTFEAVKAFQKRHGLDPDGVIGKGTVGALNFSKEKRKEQIIANLERWRWFDNQLSENYVIINIPDYSLNVVENKDTVTARKVVVGKSTRKTPILSSELKTVVFNPTWTVPPTILKEDIVPAMKRNRNYLRNKNITIYDRENNVVDPENWNEKKPHTYRYVQIPGKNNSLGLMKILFPNSHSVYLHDTNHRNLFERNNRSLSSGCVRVEDPLNLAKHILNDSIHWSMAKIDSVITTKKTTNIRIKKQYKIYQWYWTAWSDDNKLVFRTDIYNLDNKLYAQLRN